MDLEAQIDNGSILIVDDSALAVELCSMILRAAGFLSVSATTSSLDVVALHRRHRYDVILLDLAMPMRGGFDVMSDLSCHTLRAVPIIVISGEGHARLDAIKRGAIDFLGKPYDPEELTTRVRNVLRMQTLQTALLEQVQLLQEASDRLTLYRSATENAPEAIFVIDYHAERVIDANLTACTMLGVSQEVMRHSPLSTLGLPTLSACTELTQVQLGGPARHLIRADGSRVEVELRCELVGDRTRRLAAITATDLSLRSESEQRLRQLADFDTLTGLANRRQFFSTLAHTIAYAQHSNLRAAIMFIDLDRFKTINDNLGHVVGDLLLKQFGARLSGCARARDLVARLGGDEFAILMVFPLSAEPAMAVASKIRQALAQPFGLRGHALSVTASIGIALFPDDAREPDLLIQYADIAMYRAKESGRNTYRFFTPAMNARGLERLDLESALRKALELSQFHLVYQPKIDTRTGQVTGLEALLRWQRPGLGVVSPEEFIPILEETGLIVAVGAWVIQNVCMQIRAWLDHGLQAIPVAVNVSGRQFYDEELKNVIDGALRDSQINPLLLELELTESILMSNADEKVLYLTEIKKLGVTLAIDDFGTGYSSLSYLKRFPIDTIKIDIAFVRDIISNPQDSAIACAIIQMARGLNMRTVAEGVESAAQLAYLRSKMCDEVQGYFFTVPLAAGRIPEFLTTSQASQPRASPDQVESGCVLIIDDEPDLCDLLAAGLDGQHYRVLTATTPGNAFDILARHRVDVVLCDQRMPAMSGNELLRRIKTCIQIASELPCRDLPIGRPSQMPSMTERFSNSSSNPALSMNCETWCRQHLMSTLNASGFHSMS